jgi:peptidoglycan/xylan/chitin deacetylase (PgdA/CDA1 family)
MPSPTSSSASPVSSRSSNRGSYPNSSASSTRNTPGSLTRSPSSSTTLNQIAGQVRLNEAKVKLKKEKEKLQKQAAVQLASLSQYEDERPLSLTELQPQSPRTAGVTPVPQRLMPTVREQHNEADETASVISLGTAQKLEEKDITESMERYRSLHASQRNKATASSTPARAFTFEMILGDIEAQRTAEAARLAALPKKGYLESFKESLNEVAEFAKHNPKGRLMGLGILVLVIGSPFAMAYGGSALGSLLPGGNLDSILGGGGNGTGSGSTAFTPKPWVIKPPPETPIKPMAGYPKPLQPGEFAEIDFSFQQPYLPNNTLVWSFDDGPDDVNTAKVLDILKQKNVVGSFYVNIDNGYAKLPTSEKQRDVMRRMAEEGHEIASHGYHHAHMPQVAPEKLPDEIQGSQKFFDKMGPGAPKLDKFRCPYGEPFQATDRNNPTEDFKRVRNEIAKSQVHVAWGVDPKDFECETVNKGSLHQAKQCLTDKFKKELDASKYGILLTHSIHPVTVEALPEMIDEARRRGFVFHTTEDVVKARYGKSSQELVAQMNAGPT